MNGPNPLTTAEFLMSIGMNDDAKKVLDIMKPYAVTLEQIDAVGKLYAKIREFHDTLELALKAFDIAENEDQRLTLYTNIVRAYLNLNEPYKAREYINIILKHDPTDHPTRMDQAMVHFLLNEKPTGEQILRKILTEPRTQDIDHRVKFNLGTYNLSNGNFKEGLRGVLLDGRKLDIWHKFTLPVKNMWEGGDIGRGKTILLCAEGGIGDEIISIRFMKHFVKMGVRCIWYTSREDLASIFRRNGFDVITNLNQYKSDWLWCYSMSVPCYLDLSTEDLWNGPYIKPLRNKEILPGKLKIGLKCSGNPKYDQDLHRSIPAKETIDCLPKDAIIYSFHIDEDIDDPRIVSLKDKIKTWDDTFDYLDQMDIVVSSCTSLIHAAGVMEKKSVVLVPILNYYTWAEPTINTHWYADNLTIFRQKEYDNWNAPLNELRNYFEKSL